MPQKTIKKKRTKPTGEVPSGSIPKVEREVLARKNVDGTVAIMRLDNDEHFFTIDGIASEFWSLIDGKTTLAKIGEKLARKHHPPVERFQKDIKKLVTMLRKEKLIHF